jgi:hypothetical protein
MPGPQSNAKIRGSTSNHKAQELILQLNVKIAFPHLPEWHQITAEPVIRISVSPRLLEQNIEVVAGPEGVHEWILCFPAI